MKSSTAATTTTITERYQRSVKESMDHSDAENNPKESLRISKNHKGPL